MDKHEQLQKVKGSMDTHIHLALPDITRVGYLFIYFPCRQRKVETLLLLATVAIVCKSYIALPGKKIRTS